VATKGMNIPNMARADGRYGIEGFKAYGGDVKALKALAKKFGITEARAIGLAVQRSVGFSTDQSMETMRSEKGRAAGVDAKLRGFLNSMNRSKEKSKIVTPISDDVRRRAAVNFPTRRTAVAKQPTTTAKAKPAVATPKPQRTTVKKSPRKVAARPSAPLKPSPRIARATATTRKTTTRKATPKGAFGIKSVALMKKELFL